MSTYPLFLEYKLPRPRRPQDQRFGLTPQDNPTMYVVPRQFRGYYKPWKNSKAAAQVGSVIREDKKKFKVNLNVQHFALEEISVKAVDGYLVVEAKHEDKQDKHGFISRSFTRKYKLPEGVDINSMISKLSSDGILIVTAPLQPPPKQSNERIVPIIQTGPVKIQLKSKTEKGQG